VLYFPSFPSALQLGVSFGLMNNQLPFFYSLHPSQPGSMLMSISVQSIHPSIHPTLIVWFLNNLVFTV
jgi:hypothetical protein